MRRRIVLMLMVACTAFLVAVGGFVWGWNGAFAGAIAAAGLNAFALLGGPWLVLRGYRAERVTEREAPGLHQVAARLCARAEVPKPVLAIAPYPQPNAFVVGRDARHAVLCVTTELLALFDDDELAAVLAHEVAHLKIHDVLVRTFAAAVAGSMGDARTLGVLMGGPPWEAQHPWARWASAALGPVSVWVARFGMRPELVYQADAEAVRITGQPEALANALLKLERLARVRVDVPLAVELLADVEPMRGHEPPVALRGATRPSVSDRVARLAAMTRKPDPIPA